MSRLPDLPREQMTPEQAAVHDRMVAGPRGEVVGPFKPLLHSPGLCDAVQAVGAYCRFESPLPANLRELAILCVAAAWKAAFEWYAHAPLAIAAGLPRTAVAAIGAGREPELASEAERAVYAFCHALQAERAVSEGVYEAARRAVGDRGMVDLAGLVGYYTQLAMIMTTFGVTAPAETDPPLAP